MNKFKLAAAAVLLLSTSANAAVIFDNGMGQNNTTSGYYSSELQGWRVYDNFSLSQSSNIVSVWAQEGITPGAAFDSFTFSIYSDSLGAPGTEIYTQTLNPGQYNATPNSINSHPGGVFYDIEFNLSSTQTLNSGDYWLSLYGIGQTDFRAANTGAGDAFLQQNGSGALQSRPGDTPFRLMDTAVSTVPIPTAAWLFGSGLIGLMGFAKRNKA